MNVKLVPFQDCFIDEVMAWRNEAMTVLYNPVIKIEREELLKRSRENIHDIRMIEPSKQLRLYYLVDDCLVGTISLSEYNPKMQTAEFGYMIGEKHYGRGHATLMSRIFIQSVFENTDIRKIMASIHENNIPSQRVVEKLGFVKEGLFREHFLIEGKPVNEAIYGLLKREFVPLKR